MQVGASGAYFGYAEKRNGPRGRFTMFLFVRVRRRHALRVAAFPAVARQYEELRVQ